MPSLELIVETQYAQQDRMRVTSFGSFCEFSMCNIDADINLDEIIRLRDFLDQFIKEKRQ